MKLSARNALSGKLVEVSRGQTSTKVKVDVGNGVVITSTITTEAADELGLTLGDSVTAIIKSSDVVIGK